MKYCEEYAALLDPFVDGELAAKDMERVGNHLAECPGCRAYVDDALAIRAGFPDGEDTIVPEGFAEGVMKRIREASDKDEKAAERKRRGFRRWMGTAALAACCALVVLARTGAAGGDKAVPGGESGAYDMAVVAGGGTDTTAEGGEAGIAPQIESALVAPEEPPEAPAAERRAAEIYDEDVSVRAALAAAPKAALEAAMDGEERYNSSLEKEAALYLTEEEAGDLLEGFTVALENAAERRYELNAEEYRALLEALGRLEEMPEEASGSFLVVVTGPLE